MGLETGTYISDLVASNPPGTDKKSQGDDHIRLIKAILQTTFPRTAKAFRFPQNLSKSADYSVVATDDKSTFSIDTTAGTVTLTLPTLAGSDDGWSVEIIKTNTGTNPCFIAPPSGSINGFTKIRRTLEYVVTKIIWNGSSFFASRPNGGNIGSIRPFAGSALPNDCLWPDGTTFTAASFVELNSVLGGNTKPDIRGRVMAALDQFSGGAAAGRVGSVVTDSGTIVGATLLSAGGSSTHVQTSGEMPTHNHGITEGNGGNGHLHNPGTGTQFVNFSPSVASFDPVAGGNHTGSTSNTTAFATTGITINNNGSSSAMAMLQPTIMMNYGIVAE